MFVILFRQFLACSSSLLFGSVLKLTEMVRLSHIQESECVFKFFLPSPTQLSFQTVLFGFLPQSGAEFRGSPGSFAVWARVACWWASCSLCIIHASRVEGLAV